MNVGGIIRICLHCSSDNPCTTVRVVGTTGLSRPGETPDREQSLRASEDARIVNLLNDRIHNDPRVENVLLPFRDGIMLAYKL